MIKGVIFDLDGTTLNTLDDIADAFNKTVVEAGYAPRSRDAIRMGVGRGFRVLAERALPEVSDKNEKEKMALRYRENYAQEYDNKTCPYEGMTELLEKMQADGVKMAIDSNKSDFFVKSLIKKNFPGILFSDVMGSAPEYPLKPDPGKALKMIKNMGLDKKEVVYVGDSETDMATAINAGVLPVGCLWGFRDEVTLKKNGAAYLVKTPEDIYELIKEKNQ